MARHKHPRLKAIFLGSRVRPGFQGSVSEIADAACYKYTSHDEGSMVSSATTRIWYFLDGGVHETRGYFEPGSGMFVSGELAVEYILYELGEDPAVLLGYPATPRLVLWDRVKEDKANRLLRERLSAAGRREESV